MVAYVTKALNTGLSRDRPLLALAAMVDLNYLSSSWDKMIS